MNFKRSILLLSMSVCVTLGACGQQEGDTDDKHITESDKKVKQAAPISQDIDKNIEVKSSSFHEDYFVKNRIYRYKDVYIGMPKKEVFTKLGHQTGTVNVPDGKVPVYGNYGLVFNKEKRVKKFYVIPNEPFSKSDAHEIFGDETELIPSFENGSDRMIYNSKPDNGFAIELILNSNNNVIALHQYDDKSIEKPKEKKDGSQISSQEAIEQVEKFTGASLNKEKYNYKSPERTKNGWGFSYKNKQGELAGSYIVEDDGFVKVYDEKGQLKAQGYLK